MAGHSTRRTALQNVEQRRAALDGVAGATSVRGAPPEGLSPFGEWPAAGCRGVPQLRHGSRFDLADPLAGQPEAEADLVQRLGFAVVEPEAQPDDPPLPLVEQLEEPGDLLPDERLNGSRGGLHGVGVGDDVTEFVVAVLAVGGGETDRLSTVGRDLGRLALRPSRAPSQARRLSACG